MKKSIFDSLLYFIICKWHGHQFTSWRMRYPHLEIEDRVCITCLKEEVRSSKDEL